MERNTRHEPAERAKQDRHSEEEATRKMPSHPGSHDPSPHPGPQ